MKVSVCVRGRGLDKPLTFVDVLEVRETPVYLELRMLDRIVSLQHSDIFMVSQFGEPGADGVPYESTQDIRFIAAREIERQKKAGGDIDRC